MTAFYAIKSKFPLTKYLEWAANFMQLQAPIVLFTDPMYEQLFRMMRAGRPMHIITMPFEEIYMWSKYKAEWLQHHSLDREAHIHTPELYAIWANKMIWAEEAAQQNPFSTKYFFWCDIGAFRDSAKLYRYIYNFSKETPYPKGQILFSSIGRCTPDDYEVTWSEGNKRIIGNFLHKNRLVGGLWGGDADACSKWRRLFEEKLLDYFRAGRFAGKDQSVMMSAILEAKWINVLKSPREDDWFFLQEVLSGYEKPVLDESFNGLK